MAQFDPLKDEDDRSTQPVDHSDSEEDIVVEEAPMEAESEEDVVVEEEPPKEQEIEKKQPKMEITFGDCEIPDFQSDDEEAVTVYFTVKEVKDVSNQ
jgi:hypothetical protein